MSDCRVPMPVKFDPANVPSERAALDLEYKAIDEYTDELLERIELRHYRAQDMQRTRDLVARICESAQVLYHAAIKGCD